MQQPPLSLYVHLPWCERKCPYCDFNSHVTEALPEEAYVDALLHDLRTELHGETRPLETVFIGGGTPSLFSVPAISTLLAGIRDQAALPDDAEITLEANPGSTDSAKLAGFAAAGVTRFSVGVQSFDDDALHRLGRIHKRSAARAALEAAARSGASSFNVDLMHGLPEQTVNAGLSDLEQAQAAPHLSWYQLTIERNTQFFNDPPQLPVEDTLATLERRGAERLTAAGYERYEISAWARPGQQCRHNLNYWRFGDYLAIGAGAHGKVTSADGRILRYAKTRLPADYLGEGGISRRATRELGAEDRRGEFAMNALRLREGFSRRLFSERTALSWSGMEPIVAALEKQGLLIREREQVRCSEQGWRFLDDVVAAFF